MELFQKIKDLAGWLLFSFRIPYADLEGLT